MDIKSARVKHTNNSIKVKIKVHSDKAGILWIWATCKRRIEKDVLATIVAALLQRISAAHAAEAERTST